MRTNDVGRGKPIIQNLELEKVIFEVVYPLFGSRNASQVAEKEDAEDSRTCTVQ